MKLILTFFLIQGLSLSAGAVEISVGDRPISVPLPEGFVELTPEMSPQYEAMAAYVAPSNNRYLTLITKGKAEALLRGESVDLDRYVHVESEKGISVTSVTPSDFEELRGIFRDQFDELYEHAEEQAQEIARIGNEKVSSEFSADIAVQLGGLVPLPIHLDTDNAIAMSLFMTVGTSKDDEDLGDEVVAGTSLFLYVKDRVLFLYVFGSESDLDWTRETADAWAKEILAANLQTTDDERAVEESDSFGFNWSSMLGNALIGALAGGVIGFVFIFFRKRKR